MFRFLPSLVLWRSRFVKLLPPNIYRNVTESLESFDYITTHGNFSAIEQMYTRYGGAAVMYFVRRSKAQGDETRPKVVELEALN